MKREEIDKLILIEREKQDAQWGIAEDRHQSHLVWLAILGEEFGEVAQALLKFMFEHAPFQSLIDEVIDVIAVGIAWLEDRG